MSPSESEPEIVVSAAVALTVRTLAAKCGAPPETILHRLVSLGVAVEHSLRHGRRCSVPDGRSTVHVSASRTTNRPIVP
ncbi:hypothetical protein [Streptoalloteichus hindustanus]|uniref:hypothetical protein n=1 Tax=Streptoalloteichus hindustanus TaxID=2017 RepID=UPI0009357688|nr:hypothetical protein [Streptoalloteichus hindustanus]